MKTADFRQSEFHKLVRVPELLLYLPCGQAFYPPIARTNRQNIGGRIDG